MRSGRPLRSPCRRRNEVEWALAVAMLVAYAPGTTTLPSLPQALNRNAPGSFVIPAHVKTWAGEGGLGTTRNCLASVIEHLPLFL